jgi:hypothetical protein
MSQKKGFEPLPEDEYLVRMGRFEEKATKNGKGTLLSAGFEVVSGESKGRLVFHNFLVEHESKAAQKIGNDQLDKYLKAVGIADGLEGINYDRTQLGDYTEIPFIAKVVIEEPSEYVNANGEKVMSKARNKITAFKAR